MSGNYQRACNEAIRSPERFWGRAAEAIQWYRPWEHVLDPSNAPFYRWFTGGELNTCYNAIDFHVEHVPEVRSTWAGSNALLVQTVSATRAMQST